MSDTHPLTGPDLTLGLSLSEIPDDGVFLGHAFGKPVLLSRRGQEVYAVGATCSHYGAPLADGIFVDGTVRCPWHHACFSLTTGEALRAPALNPLPRFEVEQLTNRVYLRREVTDAPPQRVAAHTERPRSVVIVGAGAAADAAAVTLRNEGYDGTITVIGDDESAPYDRPNISKDYLAGRAPEDWIPLRPPGFYGDNGIRLITGRRVRRIDRAMREVRCDDWSGYPYDRMLLATGARPVRLPEPYDHNVLYLRTLADSRRIIASSEQATSAVVLGASFIGLEVAASLRARGLAVHVVAPERVPLERIMGSEIGAFVRDLHESHGVVFHLEQKARAIEPGRVTLSSGEEIPADFVVAGVGVQPNSELAAHAGLEIDGGVIVDEYLQSADPHVFAAGDVARYPDPRTGLRVRVEHWVVAQRMGQTAARNILGQRRRFDAVPFFWSRHYDTSIAYVGHAERWDEIVLEGSLDRRDCTATFNAAGQKLAVATIGRDLESLEAEVAFEESMAAAQVGN
jgi:NADPH-dependent 2,4-dienoyl-CoA reductase/sulfur reductase-like enzyme/nitrite reductase/ring-hydroxylating ferredoxin subunit